VATARRFVESKLREWKLDRLVDDALLVISELVTNAITHAASSCRVRLSINSSTLRIDVVDGGTGTPEPRPPSETHEHGRGLHMVDAVTSAWGLEEVPGEGKLVWAELTRR
jgi:signal transduction histidine kinase